MLYLMVLNPYVTDSARLFPKQGQGSHYVVQVPDHRVYVYNQWQKLRKILEAGVIKIGTDGCRHILETTFLQAHLVKRLKQFIKKNYKFLFYYVLFTLLSSH